MSTMNLSDPYTRIALARTKAETEDTAPDAEVAAAVDWLTHGKETP